MAWLHTQQDGYKPVEAPSDRTAARRQQPSSTRYWLENLVIRSFAMFGRNC